MKISTLIRKLVILATIGLSLSLVSNALALEGGTLGSADAQYIGEATGDQAGYRAVAGAGDVNGDGFDDILVGAYSNDEGGGEAGAAYLVLGGAGGRGLQTSLSHPSVIKFVGESAGDNAGYSVSGTGDVNGDGFEDFLIGAAASNLSGDNSGAVYLVLGSASPIGGDLRHDPNGVDGDRIIRYVGEASWDRAGVTVAGAGDVNGDGRDDMLVGAVGYSGAVSNSGAAYLILGNTTLNGGGLGGSGIYRYTGESFLDAAGTRVAGAGDVDGDGYADMLIGTSGDDDGGSDAGAAYLVMGSSNPASGGLAGGSGNTIYKYTGESSDDYAGIGVAGAGDVNGDGFDDILIGAEGNDSGGGNSGAAYLVLGRANPSSSGLANAIRYSGESWSDSAGYAVAGVGDVNGDSYSDMLIGADRNDDGSSNAGAAYLVFGNPLPQGGDLDRTTGDTIYRFTGEAGSDYAGGSVGAAGDVNGDGLADFLVGAENQDSGGADAGAAYLILSDFLAPGASPIRQRHRIEGAGDVLPVSFNQANVVVDFSAGATGAGEIVIERHLYHPCDTSIWLQMPIWSINSSKIDTASGSTLTLWFEYTDDQIEGMIEENLAVWRRPEDHNCRDWTQVTGATAVDTQTNRIYVTMAGVTGLSQFTLADGEPNPTAVRTVSMGAHLAQEPLWLVVLLALLVLTSGATYWYLRRKEEAALATSQGLDFTDVIASKVADLIRDRSQE